MPDPNAYGPYSPTREFGKLVFVSGQVGINPDTKETAPDTQSQTEQALINLKTTLKSAGLTMADVIKTTVFLTDMADYPAVNDVYTKHFPAPRPARSCVAVAELPRVANHPLRVEIEAVAAKP